MQTIHHITLVDCIRRSTHVLSQDDAGEAVLLDLSGERYFGLNKVGTRIWQLLASTASISEIHAVLCEEFDAAPTRVEQDLLALVEQMQDAGLIELA